MAALEPQRLELQADKRRLRRWATGVRAGLETIPLSLQVTEHLLAWSDFGAAQHVLTYLAFSGELDLSGLLTRTPGKTFYATRTNATGRLTVHKLTGRGPAGLEPHPYGFLQPPPSTPVPPERLDLALVPGLAFDSEGNRLGYGKGFYDRLLPRLRPGAPTVGVVPEALTFEKLPTEPHDRLVTHLATERGIRALR